MADAPPTTTRDALPVGQPVEVWCSFDHGWHSGFLVHHIDSGEPRTMVMLRRADGTLLPTSVDASLVRRHD
jgi:hypothetical protein